MRWIWIDKEYEVSESDPQGQTPQENPRQGMSKKDEQSRFWKRNKSNEKGSMKDKQWKPMEREHIEAWKLIAEEQ